MVDNQNGSVKSVDVASQEVKLIYSSDRINSCIKDTNWKVIQAVPVKQAYIAVIEWNFRGMALYL